MFIFKYKKHFAVVLVIAVFFLVGYFVGRSKDTDNRIIYEAQLNGALKTADKYGLEYVYLKDLTEFQWENACVVLPYMSNEDIKQKTGITYHDFTDHEGQWGLLFIDKNKNFIPVKIERYNAVDVVDAYDKRYGYKGAVYCANKDNAKLVFYVEKRFGRRVAALVVQ